MVGSIPEILVLSTVHSWKFTSTSSVWSGKGYLSRRGHLPNSWNHLRTRTMS